MTVPTARVDPLGVPLDVSRAERPLLSALHVVWRGRWIILSCVLISIVVGILRISFSVPVYHSSATILIQESMPTIVGDVLSNNGQSSGYLFTQCEIIKSSAILAKVLDTAGRGGCKVPGGYEQPGSVFKKCGNGIAGH